MISAPSWSPGTTAAAFPCRSEKTCAERSRTHLMVVKRYKLHNILRSSLCSILSKMALLLSSFRANMCTPKGKHTKRKRRIHHERENSKADRRDEKPDHRDRG